MSLSRPTRHDDVKNKTRIDLCWHPAAFRDLKRRDFFFKKKKQFPLFFLFFFYKTHLWSKLGHANYWPKVELNTYGPSAPAAGGAGPAAAQSIDTGARRISSGCTYTASSRGRNCIISPTALDESSVPIRRSECVAYLSPDPCPRWQLFKFFRNGLISQLRKHSMQLFKYLFLKKKTEPTFFFFKQKVPLKHQLVREQQKHNLNQVRFSTRLHF